MPQIRGPAPSGKYPSDFRERQCDHSNPAFISERWEVPSSESNSRPSPKCDDYLGVVAGIVDPEPFWKIRMPAGQILDVIANERIVRAVLRVK